MKIISFFKDVVFEINVFWKKTIRAYKFVKFSYKYNYWDEYDNFIRLICLYLDIMSKQFKDNGLCGSYHESEKMQLAKKLLEYFLNEHYSLSCIEMHQSHNDLKIAIEKDERCKNLAFDIIKQHIDTWWI